MKRRAGSRPLQPDRVAVRILSSRHGVHRAGSAVFRRVHVCSLRSDSSEYSAFVNVPMWTGPFLMIQLYGPVLTPRSGRR